MAFTVANILAGSLRLEYDPTLAGLIGDAEGAAPWVKLGFTKDGLQLNTEADVEFVNVDQVAVPVHVLLNLVRGVVNVAIAEHKLESLLIAHPGTAERTITPTPDPITRTQAIGAGDCDDDSLVPFRFRAIGTGPGATVRTLMFYKAIASGNAEQVFTRTGIRMIPTTIEAQSDGTNPLWRIEDV